MAHQSSAFFVVPPAHMDELRALAARVYTGSRSSVELYETFMRENQLFDRARECASHVFECTAERACTVAIDLMSCLRSRAWHADTAVLAPEECSPFLEAMDWFEDHRGSREEVFRLIGEYTPSVDLLRTMYTDLRQCLARAVAENAAFAWAYYHPDAEQKAEAARQKERELAERIARREREGPPRRTPEEERELAEKRARVQADLDRLVAEGHERYWASYDPDDPENEPHTSPYVVVYPASHLDQALASDRRSDELWQSGAYDASFAEVLERNAILLQAAHDEERYELQGQQCALDLILDWIYPDSGVERREWGHHPPDETRALADALDRFIRTHGGRDATIEHLIERARGHSRVMSQHVLDTMTRLLHRARDHAAALSILHAYQH